MSASSIGMTAALVVAWLAAASDARTQRIPNALTLPVLLAAPVAWGIAAGPRALVASLAGALLCALAPYALFRAGAGGGGDVKLFAAVGALVGPARGLEVELLGFTLAILAALVAQARAGHLGDTLGNVAHLVLDPVLPARLRRPVAPASMSRVRLGLPVALATSLLSVRELLLPRVGA